MTRLKRILRRHPFLLLLLLADIALAIILVDTLVVDPGMAGADAALPHPPDPVALAVQAQVSKETFTVIIERPLFNAGRRLIAPAAAAAAPTPVKPPPPAFPPIEVLGLAQSSRTAVAVLRLVPEGRVVMLKEGEGLQGWVVSAIDADRVRFERDGEQKEFRMPKPQSLNGIGILGKPSVTKP